VKDFQIRPCPSCEATELVPNSAVRRSRPAEELAFEEIRLNWVGFRNDQLFFTFRRCLNCQLLYSPVYLTQFQLNELYSAMPDNSAGERRDVLKETQLDYARHSNDKIAPSGQWLDLGADVGFFAEALLEQVRPGLLRIDAVEPNQSVHSELRMRLNGGEIYNSIAACHSDTYVGVSAIHVLDHLLELREALNEVRRVLQPEGLLIAVVHNEASLLRRVLQKRWPPFCLQHPQLFSPRSITTMLELHGFEVIRCRKTKNYFTIRHLVEVGCDVLKLPKAIARFTPKLRIGFRFGNIQVVARVVN
jgi:hypothetical protein